MFRLIFASHVVLAECSCSLKADAVQMCRNDDENLKVWIWERRLTRIEILDLLENARLCRQNAQIQFKSDKMLPQAYGVELLVKRATLYVEDSSIYYNSLVCCNKNGQSEKGKVTNGAMWIGNNWPEKVSNIIAATGDLLKTLVSGCNVSSAVDFSM